MFSRLKQKWNVSNRQFVVIFIAFGCTGLTAAYLTKVITSWVGMDENSWWVYRWLIKLSMLLFGYHLLLLFYGGLFGEWKFFWSFEKRLLQRLRIIKNSTPGPATLVKIAGGNPIQQDRIVKETVQPQPSQSRAVDTMRIAIFASGAGSNARQIIRHFAKHDKIEVALIVCNKPGAGVLAIAEENKVNTLLINREEFITGDGYVMELKNAGIDFIVLAGFLWKIPDALIQAYPNRIINIHPALLPKYGGKGMYGSRVHEAVIAAGEKESGITIHYVDGHYDNGDIIMQATCPIEPGDSPEMLAAKVHQLEHRHYPEVVEKLLTENIQIRSAYPAE